MVLNWCQIDARALDSYAYLQRMLCREVASAAVCAGCVDELSVINLKLKYLYFTVLATSVAGVYVAAGVCSELGELFNSALASPAWAIESCTKFCYIRYNQCLLAQWSSKHRWSGEPKAQLEPADSYRMKMFVHCQDARLW